MVTWLCGAVSEVLKPSQVSDLDEENRPRSYLTLTRTGPVSSPRDDPTSNLEAARFVGSDLSGSDQQLRHA